MICVNVHRFQGPSHHPVVYVPAAGVFVPSTNTPLEFMSMYFIYFVIVKRFQGPLVKFSKCVRSAQVTMPARRSSKFCAKRHAVLLPIFFLSLICRVIAAHIEPSPECQPEQSDS